MFFLFQLNNRVKEKHKKINEFKEPSKIKLL
jgi:hypothetical protein